MNNHKILWKTSVFKWIQILLCIVPLFVPSWTKITYDEANIKVFDRFRSFESELIESLRTTKNLLAEPEFETASLSLLYAGAVVPVPGLSAAAGIIFVLRALLAEESDWRKSFAKTVSQQYDAKLASMMVQLMQMEMETIASNFVILRANDTDTETRKMVALMIHNTIDKVIHVFDNGLFQTYPLIATPPMIQLTLLIRYFDPIAKIIIPNIRRSPVLSCKMRSILLNYLPRAINARLEKMSLTSYVLLEDKVPLATNILTDSLHYAISIESNPFGYSISIPPIINCNKGCRKPTQLENFAYTKIRPMLLLSWFKILVTKPHEITPGRLCLQDDFGTDEYLGTVTCMIDYALLIRYRVEEMFRDPISFMETTCVNPPQETGFGWLTIRLRYVRAHRTWDNKACDEYAAWRRPCDPYVKLFINNDELLKTPVEDNNCCYDLDVTYASNRISKSAIIKIEVWDDDGDDNPDLVLRTEGNIDSFLSNGHKAVPITFKEILHYLPYRRNVSTENSIDTISFWKDEYDWKHIKKN